MVLQNIPECICFKKIIGVSIITTIYTIDGISKDIIKYLN